MNNMKLNQEHQPLMICIHENVMNSRSLEKLVSKVEYFFSTCTQKVKNRMLTQETLERDQGINRREKRVSCFIEEERGDF